MPCWCSLIAQAEARGWIAGLKHRDHCTDAACVCRSREDDPPEQPEKVICPEHQTNPDDPEDKPIGDL